MAAPKKIEGPVLVRTSKVCFLNGNRYYPGDTLVYRGKGEIPAYLTPVETAAEEAAEPPADAGKAADALS